MLLASFPLSPAYGFCIFISSSVIVVSVVVVAVVVVTVVVDAVYVVVAGVVGSSGLGL